MTTFATGCSGTIGKFFPASVVSVKMDIRSNIEKFEQIGLGKADVLIHAAAVVGPSVVEKDPQAAKEVNVEGTRKLGLTTLKSDISKFVYVSTSHVYRFGPDFLAESDEISPVNEYARQKYEGEKVLQEIFSKAPEKLCILRVFSILDWGMPELSLGGAIEKLAKRTPDFVIQNTDDVRDFLSPRQAAELIYEVSRVSEASGILNVCTSNPISVAQAVRQIFELENIQVDESCLLSGNSLVPRIVGDNSKLKALLPNISLDWKPGLRVSSNGDIR